MIDLNVKDIIAKLSEDTTLTSLLASVDYDGTIVPAIYRELPESEDIDGIYVMLSNLDTPNGTLDAVDLLEVRIMGGNEKVTYSQVEAVDRRITELLLNNFDYDSFKLYNVVVRSGRPLLNEKDRKEYVRDYDLYFLR